ncbi:hypothetical protein [Campylobacter canadensis]|uniref:hypothetical protein n=1 Tax=Campylobacter canadensis TaxID=449520 RepID=UPI001CCA5E4F|nr:hypothetical protein [Campylobacter canadensis]MBZ7999059.1 hypothetical protein [Campylobacter canadensis]
MQEEKVENQVIDELVPKSKILACPQINLNLVGNITSISENKASMSFMISNEFITDSLGLAHSGFIYSAAAYLAQVAINNANTCILSSKSSFFTPCKVGEELFFEASAKFDNAKKREVFVEAFTREIKVFEAHFYILVTDEHILKMQQSELSKYQNKKSSK